MANATGRPTAAVILGRDERDYLERQVVSSARGKRDLNTTGCEGGLNS